MTKKQKANGKGTPGTEPPAPGTGNPSVPRSKKPFFLISFVKNSYPRLGPKAKVALWANLIRLLIAIAAFSLGFFPATKKGVEATQRAIKEGQDATQKAFDALIHIASKADLPELERRFAGGFTAFGLLTGDSATAGHKIIRSSTSHSIDVTWDSAKISELSPSSLTMQLQNVKIIRTETTPTGTQPAGAIILNGTAIWQIDRRTNLVSINNAIGFWGYVIGGFVLYDKNDVLIVALGLQRVE